MSFWISWKQCLNIFGGGGLVQWFKPPAWKVRDRGARPPLWHSGFTETNVSSPLTLEDLILWGASVRGSELGLEFRSLCMHEGQCHLIHLTILRRFFWPSLAYTAQRWLKTTRIHSFILSQVFITGAAKESRWSWFSRWLDKGDNETLKTGRGHINNVLSRYTNKNSRPLPIVK